MAENRYNMIVKRIVLIILSLMILAGCAEESSGNEEEIASYPTSPAVTRDEVLHSVFDDYTDASIVNLSLSTASDGYIGAALKEEDGSKVKMRIVKDDMTYTYDVSTTEMIAYPLQMGDGTYLIKVLEQIEGTSYAVVFSKEINVSFADEMSVYLYPNQVVDYDNSDMVIDISFDKVKDDDNDLKRVYDLYRYVLKALDYDNEKAKNVADIYTLPDIEDSIERGKGICFDYASLLAALCRIQHIPARVIVGYTDIEYHAWCEIYLENEGWINPKFFFNGQDWSTIDPTFADSGQDYEGNYDEVYRY